MDPRIAKEQFGNPRFADLLVRCGHREWPVHRVVVCNKSTRFDVACQTTPVYGPNKQILNVTNFDAATIHRLLQYLYTDEYDDDDAQTQLQLPPLAIDTPQPSPQKLLEGPVSTPGQGSANESNGSYTSRSSNDLLIDVKNDEGFQAAMTNVCTDLQQLDLAAPAPFSHPVLVKFWNNFRVFNASKEFGVPLLTVLSLNKMDVDLQSTYPLVGFTELVRVVFDTTNTIIEEPALFLAEGCASHISSLIRYTSFENLLKVKPLLGYLVIKELVKHLGVSPTAGEVAVPADSVISFDNHGSSTAENAAAAAAQATDGAPPSPANPAGVPPQRLKENEPLDAVPGVLALRMQAAAKQQMSNGSSALPPPLSSRTNGQLYRHRLNSKSFISTRPRKLIRTPRLTHSMTATGHTPSNPGSSRPGPSNPRPSNPGPSNSGNSKADRVLEVYNGALRSATLDFKSCNNCYSPFYAQFRGAPENESINALILQCTSCNGECTRWTWK
ncbi:hypothetical protein M8818_007656 [Zalaria obscura]|uniref:Uncharacterized protein n=1 Tax=Zalaria obscura TaxID=2024903 RepID=A0ACC3S5V7_9PEZI